ncbi:MAG: BatA domain-containing protein [Pirellulales bacterium]
MPSFLYESLLWWGLPLIGVPVLIHLINLMRHRRVQWAAMEFLLASQKRHQKSILFKQLLLLLMRMLAIAALVLMVAQPMLRNQWGALFGGARTHHIVLLDDSFSMSDRWADTSAFEQAKEVVGRLAAQAAQRDTAQLFSIVRFSRAQRIGRGVQPDMLEQPLNANFAAQLEEVLGPLSVSETAAEAQDALAAIDRLPGKPADEERIVYIVSDYRARQWQDPAALRKAMSRLDESGVQLHLVNCVTDAHQNLAVAALRPAAGTRAAGVPLLVEVTLQNFGPGDAKAVSVSLEEDGHPRPAIVVEDLPAGKQVTRRFPSLFAVAGQHEIVARLPSDAVPTDNRRALVVDVPDAVDVLIVDGDPQAKDAFFLAAALSPGGKTTSGLRPVIESPAFLRGRSLDSFSTIYLLNVERLEAVDVATLEAFVKSGGGVGIFLGDRTRAELINEQLFRGGEGLFPLPLAGPAELVVDRLERAPDLEVTDHPIFAVFAGERNSFLSTVTVQRYFAAPQNWAPDPESSTRVIARLRNKAPLAVERTFGAGRVLAILTKASPAETALGAWNNWGRNNPSYVVAMLEMQSYLSQPRYPDTSRLLGTPLSVAVDVAKFLPQVRFGVPSDEANTQTLLVDATTTPQGHRAVLGDTAHSGVYQAQLTGTDGSQRTERFAFNVTPEEGDLAKFSSAQLAGGLEGLRYEYHEAADINYNPQQLAGFNLSTSLLIILIVVLLAEQALAYACSYHPPAKEGAGR